MDANGAGEPDRDQMRFPPHHFSVSLPCSMVASLDLEPLQLSQVHVPQGGPTCFSLLRAGGVGLVLLTERRDWVLGFVTRPMGRTKGRWPPPAGPTGAHIEGHHSPFKQVLLAPLSRWQTRGSIRGDCLPVTPRNAGTTELGYPAWEPSHTTCLGGTCLASLGLQPDDRPPERAPEGPQVMQGVHWHKWGLSQHALRALPVRGSHGGSLLAGQ